MANGEAKRIGSPARRTDMLMDPRRHRARIGKDYLAMVAALAGLCLAATQAFAKHASPYAQINAQAASSEIAVHPVRGNVSVLEGSGGNIIVLASSDGIFMVDAGIAVSKAKIQAALHNLDGGGAIKFVVNTHWHWDHTDGNGWVKAAGATVVAHPNTLRHLSSTIRVVEWDHTFAPVSRGDLPTMEVSSEKTLQFAGEDVRVEPYVASHTDGDLSVYFPAEDVLATGDTWWNGLYPFIDYVAGGSIDGMIRAADANVARASEHTLVVPGHGPVGDRTQLIEFRDMLKDIRARVAALKAQGKSLKQAIAAKPTAAYDAKWGGAVISPALFTTLVYRGV
jgi:glyoxylase-like metal-dependent hydrolase (beta-lactamase superfamily II)